MDVEVFNTVGPKSTHYTWVIMTRVISLLGAIRYKRLANSPSFAPSESKPKDVSYILASGVAWPGGSHLPLTC